MENQKWSFLLLFTLCLCFSVPVSIGDKNIICEFKYNNTCGYKNQDNLLQMEIIEELATVSTSGMFILDLSKVNLSQSHGARIYSKYYLTHAHSEACLLVKFLTYGPGIENWSIIQRNSFQDIRLFEYTNDWYPYQHRNINLDRYWISMTLPIDLTGGPVMFFIEVVSNGYTPNGIFVIDHIVFLYQKCPFKQMPHYPCWDKSCPNPYK